MPGSGSKQNASACSATGEMISAMLVVRLTHLYGAWHTMPSQDLSYLDLALSCVLLLAAAVASLASLVSRL